MRENMVSVLLNLGHLTYSNIPRTLSPTTQTFAHPCSLPLYSQQAGTETTLDIDQEMNG